MGYNDTGKSSIALKFLYDFPDASNLGPEENYYTSIKYKAENFLLHIVDFAGMDDYTPIYASKYGVKVDGYILVYAVDNRKSFEFIQELREKLKAINGRDVPSLLVANKSDLKETREVSTEEGKRLSRALEIPYLEVSAKRHATDFIKKVFEVMLREIIKNENPGNGLKILKNWDHQKVEQLYDLFLFASMLLALIGVFFVSFGVMNLLVYPELIQTQGVILVLLILNGFIILTLSVLGTCGMKKGETDCISVFMVLVVLSAIFDIVCTVLKFCSKPLTEEGFNIGDSNIMREYIDLDPLVYIIIAASFIILMFVFGVSCLSKEISIKKRLNNENKYAVLKV